MGISKVVAVNSAVLFGVCFSFRKRAPWPILITLLHSSIASFLVSVSSHPSVNCVHLFCKSRDGYFPWWSHVLFYPYMLSVKGYVYARRKQTTEPVFTEVSEGIYVGGWPYQPSDVPPGEPAIIDCTCELPRSECVENLPYLCIPTWDSRAPLVEDIEQAVQWASEKRKEKRPVFIHCAFGHGRSVTVACALLISLGVVGTWEDAHKLIKNRRPSISMNEPQIKNFEEWLKRR